MSDIVISKKSLTNDIEQRFNMDYDQAVSLATGLEKYKGYLNLLRQYDEGYIETPPLDSLQMKMYLPGAAGEYQTRPNVKPYTMTHGMAKKVVCALAYYHAPKNGMFGREYENGALANIVSRLYQTAGGEDVYPTLPHKAVNLLYLIIKNHPFVDGNKRIASFLFCLFMDWHTPYISEHVVGNYRVISIIAKFIAESNPREKDMVISLVMNLFLLPEPNA